MAKPKKRTGCKQTTISFRTARGRKVSFKGRTGPTCGPRSKPSTRHLRVWKDAMKDAASDCAIDARGKAKKGKSFNRKAYTSCLKDALKQVGKAKAIRGWSRRR